MRTFQAKVEPPSGQFERKTSEATSIMKSTSAFSVPSACPEWCVRFACWTWSTRPVWIGWPGVATTVVFGAARQWPPRRRRPTERRPPQVRRVARFRRETSDAPTVRGRVRDAAALSPERARVVEAQKALAAAQKAGIPHVYRHVAVRRPDVDADEGPAARGVEVRAELVGERRRPVFFAVSLVREPQCLHAIDETSRPPAASMVHELSQTAPHVIAATRRTNRIDGVEAA